MKKQRNNNINFLISPPMNRFNKRSLPVNTVDALNDTGLDYVIAAAKQAGADVKLVSWRSNWNISTIRKKLLAYRPDIVGLKVFTNDFYGAYTTLRTVRETLPQAITIIGGPHPSTSQPQNIFTEFDTLLDFAIAGDGERGISELLKQIVTCGGKPSGNELSKIPGLIYRYGNQICANRPCFDDNLDDLEPIDWSLQQPSWFGTAHGIDKISTGALIMDSRGCPARCAFCLSHKINGTKPRHRSLENLVREIRELVYKYNVRALVFTGNAFMSDLNYVKELSNWFIKLNIPLKWSCTGANYIHQFLNNGLLKLMRRAGCEIIHFGVESGDLDIRKLLNQPASLDTIGEVVNLTANAGIRAAGYFMFGFPEETIQNINNTIKYALSLPFDTISFAVCLPLPGTSSYKTILKQKGIDRIDWAKYNFAKPSLLPCQASSSQIQRKVLESRFLKQSGVIRYLYNRIHKYM